MTLAMRHIKLVNGKFHIPSDPMMMIKKCHIVICRHMGMATMQHAPYGKGFKTSLGYFHADEDHFTQNYTEKPIDNVTCSGIDLWDTDKPAYGINGTFGGYLYSDRALKIINGYTDKTSKPLFMYLATQCNHGPLEAPQSYIDKFNASWNQAQRTYAAMMNFVDEIIGNVTTALKKNNMWDNTLLFISSDNGGPPAANNHPLRGGKFSNFQGGVRVLGMISGGYLPKFRRGKELNGTIHIADWYSTICSIVGINPTDTRAEQAGLPPIDSINMWPWIIDDGNTSVVSPRNEFVLSSLDERNGGGGLIMGDYKLLFGTQDPAYWTTLDFPNGTTPEPQSIDCGSLEDGGCLFNIKLDPTEHEDIVNKSENKALVQEMRERYIELLNTTYTPNTGDTDPRCCQQIEINGGYWGPWLNMTQGFNVYN